MTSQDLSLVNYLAKLLRRYKFLLLSTIVVTTGIGLVLYSRLAPTIGIVQELAKDFGIGLFTSGIIGLVLEYYTREQFLVDTRNTVLSALEISPVSTKLDSLRELVSSGMQLQSLGVRRIYRSRAEIDLAGYIRNAEPGSEIRVLAIAMVTFADVQTQLAIERKLQDGCTIKLLMLDPDCDVVKQRAAEEERDYRETKRDIVATKYLFSNLLRRLPQNLRQHIELGYYTVSPSWFILWTTNTMLVGPYLSKTRGFLCPHLELDIKEGGIYAPFAKHFEYLWAIRQKSSDLDDEGLP